MFAKILFFPLLAVVVIVGLIAFRTALGGLGTSRAGRMFKIALLAAVMTGGGLWLMYGLDEPWAPWAAVGLLALVVLPLFAPIAVLVLALFSAKLSGKPIRWN